MLVNDMDSVGSSHFVRRLGLISIVNTVFVDAMNIISLSGYYRKTKNRKRHPLNQQCQPFNASVILPKEKRL